MRTTQEATSPNSTITFMILDKQLPNLGLGFPIYKMKGYILIISKVPSLSKSSCISIAKVLYWNMMSPGRQILHTYYKDGSITKTPLTFN